MVLGFRGLGAQGLFRWVSGSRDQDLVFCLGTGVVGAGL